MLGKEMKIGEKVPDICLRDQDAIKRCLSDYRGKWIVLYFYPEDDTTGCTTEARTFSQAQEDFRLLGTEVIGVSPDSIESHFRFAKKHNINLTLLSDRDHEMLQSFGAWKIKTRSGRESSWAVERSTVLIDPDGRVQYVWPHVQIDGHVQEVRNVLIKLQERYAKGELALPATTEKAEMNTDERINQEIYQRTLSNIARFVGKPKEDISVRLRELESEWDIERTLESNAAAVVMIGTVFGFTRSRWWFLLSGIAGFFLLQHAFQGWCPPLSLYRRLGIRSAKEISGEKTSLKILRGDFRGHTEDPEELYTRAQVD